MAELNFNLLQSGNRLSPVNAFFQGQQAAQDREMAQQDRQAAQQDAVQRREFDALRKQQIVSQMQAAEQTQNRELIAGRTQQYRDRLLRAGTPDAVRNLIRQRHADPVLSRAMQQFGTLDEDLAEVPDDVTAFQDYLTLEAMGAAEFIKFTQEGRNISQIMGGGGSAAAPAPAAAPAAARMTLPAGDQLPGDFTSTQAMGRVPGVVTAPILPSPPPMNAMMPAPMTAAPLAPVNALRPPAAGPDVAEMRRQRDALLLMGGPRAKALADKLQLDITAAATATSADIKTMQALGYPITQQGFQQYRDAQRPERLLTTEEEAQQLRLRLASRPPGVSITNVGEKAETAEFGKLLVAQFDAISKQASVAARTLPSIEANLNELNKGFDTGFGTDAKKAAARVLGALGVKDATDFATSAEVFQSNAISAVLQKQLEQKGPQTESDARRIEQIGAELGKTKDANRFILDLAREQLRRDLDQRNFYMEWKKGPGKNSFNGAEDAWFNGEGGKSLFDRPALRKYAVGATSPAAQIPTGAAPARAAPANVITNPQFPGFSIGK